MKTTILRMSSLILLTAAVLMLGSPLVIGVGFHGGGMAAGGFHGGMGVGGAMPDIGAFGGSLHGSGLPSNFGGDLTGGLDSGFGRGGLPTNLGGSLPAAFDGSGLPSALAGGGNLPASMPQTNFPTGDLNRVAGLDHAGLPGFPTAASALAGRGDGATTSQLGNFLGLRDGMPPLTDPGPARPSGFSLPDNPLSRTNIGPLLEPGPALPGGMDKTHDSLPLGPGPAWPEGHAGNFPSWSNLTPETKTDIDNINHHIINTAQPGGPHSSQVSNWLENNPDRVQHWQDRGDQVRRNWNDPNHPFVNNNSPKSDWWNTYHPNLDPWYYHHGWHNHGWAYWWGTPTWAAIGTWFPAWGWSQPIFYDCSDGGNVVYQNQNVYVNGQAVGNAAAYAQSAGSLATVDPQQAESTPNDDQWMALGTFAIETSDTDTSTTRLLQLAVDQQGIISGTMHNSSTSQSYVVQGRVDKQTQRVAFTIGDKSDVVMETGIYNLTQQQTPVLVHFGTDHTENYLLVRLDPPKDPGEDSDITSSDTANPLAP
jgi:hypothetical protein